MRSGDLKRLAPEGWTYRGQHDGCAFYERPFELYSRTWIANSRVPVDAITASEVIDTCNQAMQDAQARIRQIAGPLGLA